MAYSEYILSETKCSETLGEFLREGCRVAYDLNAEGRIVYLVPSVISDLLDRDAVHLAIKHDSFASDEPIVVRYRNGDVSWFQFDELGGDGHLKVVIRRISDATLTWYSISLAYGSFYVNRDEIYLKPHPELVGLYKRKSRYLKNGSKRIDFSGSDIFVSADVLEEGGDRCYDVIHRFLYK